ncbi:MAG: GtrA family protein [Candidatus Limnocylindrales bacterium]
MPLSRSTLQFLAVGGTGLVVNQLVFVALTELGGLHYLVSAVLATVSSTTWNFVLADRWVFGGRRPRMGQFSRYGTFAAVNLGMLAVRGPMLIGLTEGLSLDYAWSNVISLVSLTAARLAFADLYIWRTAPTDVHQEPSAPMTAIDPGPMQREQAPQPARASRYMYDVAGIIAIHSDVVLRELTFFRTDVWHKPDIRITVGMVSPRPTARIRFEQRGSELIYREHVGPVAANFSVRMDDPIHIKVNPILALSPHVVYTNIVEAFLRFLFVSRGYVLLHSAALADARGATLMSAQTDTGKTSTVITLVRRHGYRFLSDDMTIIDAAAGEAISYPKPMTLSFHTMGVAKDGRLSMGDRAALSVQSRLHSKSGRQVGRALGERNIPIMTINSAVQALVPPPKHRIEALFECQVGGRAPIRNVVLMERGPDRLESLDIDVAVRRLIENTDDAYGFPPFATFSPRIRIGGDDYEALRRKEVELLRRAIGGSQLWDLHVPGHGWADVLPQLIDGPAPIPVGPGLGHGETAPVPVGPGLGERDAAPVPVGPGLGHGDMPASPVGYPLASGIGDPVGAGATGVAAMALAFLRSDSDPTGDMLPNPNGAELAPAE